MSNLNPQQFPVHEKVGYGESDRVSPEKYGLYYDPEVDWPDVDFAQHEDRRVPLSKVTATQGYVYQPHVENLSRIPAHVLEAQSSSGLPQGYPVGDRVLLSMGHHRVAAAAHRGDTDALIRVYKSETN